MNKWRMKDGREIAICDMSDSHLENTLRLLIRTAANFIAGQRAIYASLPKPTAEHALDAFTQEVEVLDDSTWEDFTPEVFDELEAEYERRGFDMLELRQYGAALELQCDLEALGRDK